MKIKCMEEWNTMCGGMIYRLIKKMTRPALMFLILTVCMSPFWAGRIL